MPARPEFSYSCQPVHPYVAVAAKTSLKTVAMPGVSVEAIKLQRRQLVKLLLRQLEHKARAAPDAQF